MDEMVAAVDALSREALSRLVTSLLGSLPALAVGTTMSALGPLRGLLLPVPTPFEILTRWGLASLHRPGLMLTGSGCQDPSACPG